MKNRIKELRESIGITQRELGIRMGVTERTVQRWESGKNEPSYDDLKVMSSLFSCNIDYILMHTDIKKSFAINDSEFFLLAKDLEETGLTPADFRDLMQKMGVLKQKHLKD